jgi:hypothetical protein
MRMTPGPLRLALVIASLGSFSQPVSAQTLNDKVVQFCKAHLGKQVGDGECTALAATALRDASAKTFADFPNRPGRNDFVWGDLIYTLQVEKGRLVEEGVVGQTIKPGDVVQFRNATIKGKVQGGSYSFAYPQHTAVVLEMHPKTKQMVLLHQNLNGKRIVQRTGLRLSDLRTGWLRVYRPVAK